MGNYYRGFKQGSAPDQSVSSLSLVALWRLDWSRADQNLRIQFGILLIVQNRNWNLACLVLWCIPSVQNSACHVEALHKYCKIDD